MLLIVLEINVQLDDLFTTENEIIKIQIIHEHVQ